MATKSTSPNPENSNEEEYKMSTAEEFQLHFAACLQIAATDLPQVLAQQRAGSNPEHQKQIQNLERVISDGTVPAETIAILQAQVEKMKPQLSWSQGLVSEMLAVYDTRLQSDADKELSKAVATEVLRRGSSASGKGKKSGTGVQRVSGALKAVHLHCMLCDQMEQPARRSDSATAPTHIANDIRKHMQDPHKFQFNTKQLEETVRQVVMGDLPRATIRNEAGEPVFQIAPSETVEVPASENGAAAAVPAAEPETV